MMTCLAVKDGKEYRYESAQASCFGPCHPDYRRSALICLTTSGDLRLIWPQSDGKWYETSSEIESIVSSNDLITHATICADKSMTPFGF
jgi:mediator of RNA polymerase II transcription subunit 16, fungi type